MIEYISAPQALISKENMSVYSVNRYAFVR